MRTPRIHSWEYVSLELESISNDVEDCFWVRDWPEKFGESSVKFADKLTAKKEDVDELAKILEKDFESGEWMPDNEGRLYNYLMPTFYGGFIDACFEKQLAGLTGIGTQLKLEF